MLHPLTRAVTAAPAEYFRDVEIDKAVEEVRVYVVERCELVDEDGDEVGGHQIYWMPDGSDTGILLVQVWGWRGDWETPVPLVGKLSDYFDEATVAALEDWNDCVEEVDIPGVTRQYKLSESDWQELGFEDLLCPS